LVSVTGGGKNAKHEASSSAVYEALHAEGTVRIATAIKIGTRTDKEPSLRGKLF
jgi:uncharacterized protein YqgV (UPF0045/DUF77 family)